MTLFAIISVVLLVLANGFFVAAEFALVKVRLSQVEELAKKGSWAAGITEKVLNRLDAYLSACQLGITLASLGLGWVGEPFVAHLLEPIFAMLGVSAERTHYFALPIAFFTISALHIIVGELAPKSLAIRAARPTALACAPPLMLFFKVFWPFIWLLNTAANYLIRLCGILPIQEGVDTHTSDELRLILAESAAGGELSRRERLMMENVLDLEDKAVRQVMVPRRDVVYLNTRRTIEENLELITESRHTRFPLCDGELDRVVGMVHTKDVLITQMKGEKLATLSRLARKIPFMAETMRLDVVLREFQKNRTHVAMVVDEFGTISGMVTFENVLEEIIGPIQDEFDRELPHIIKRSTGRYHVDALCPVDELVEQVGVTIPDEIDADTTGGLVVELIGRIPQVGERARLGRYEIRVLDAEPTRVRRVELIEVEPDAGGESPPRGGGRGDSDEHGADRDDD